MSISFSYDYILPQLYHIHTHTHTHTHVYVRTHIHTLTHTRTQTHTHHTHTYTRTHPSTHSPTQPHLRTRAYTHTHTHTGWEPTVICIGRQDPNTLESPGTFLCDLPNPPTTKHTNKSMHTLSEREEQYVMRQLMDHHLLTLYVRQFVGHS